MCSRSRKLQPGARRQQLRAVNRQQQLPRIPCTWRTRWSHCMCSAGGTWLGAASPTSLARWPTTCARLCEPCGSRVVTVLPDKKTYPWAAAGQLWGAGSHGWQDIGAVHWLKVLGAPDDGEFTPGWQPFQPRRQGALGEHTCQSPLKAQLPAASLGQPLRLGVCRAGSCTAHARQERPTS